VGRKLPINDPFHDGVRRHPQAFSCGAGRQPCPIRIGRGHVIAGGHPHACLCERLDIFPEEQDALGVVRLCRHTDRADDATFYLRRDRLPAALKSPRRLLVGRVHLGIRTRGERLDLGAPEQGAPAEMSRGDRREQPTLHAAMQRQSAGPKDHGGLHRRDVLLEHALDIATPVHAQRMGP